MFQHQNPMHFNGKNGSLSSYKVGFTLSLQSFFELLAIPLAIYYMYVLIIINTFQDKKTPQFWII